MILADSPVRLFVWSKLRGDYYSRPGSAAYVVYRDKVYPIDGAPVVSGLFRSVEGLVWGRFQEVADMDAVRQALRDLNLDLEYLPSAICTIPDTAALITLLEKRLT